VILWDFIRVKKTKFLIPKICWPGLRRSNDVHKMCTAIWLKGRSTARSPESFTLWIWPRLTGRSTGRSNPKHGRPVGCNGQKCDRWPVDRPVNGQQYLLLSWPPTASFWEPIKWGSLGLFKTRFWVGFQASFPYLSKKFSPLFLELILPYQKESIQQCFSK